LSKSSPVLSIGLSKSSPALGVCLSTISPVLGVCLLTISPVSRSRHRLVEELTRFPFSVPACRRSHLFPVLGVCLSTISPILGVGLSKCSPVTRPEPGTLTKAVDRQTSSLITGSLEGMREALPMPFQLVNSALNDTGVEEVKSTYI